MTQNAINRNGATLGQRLRDARKERGITITRLARELDVDPRTVARWQSDEAMPSVVRLGEIARVLEKSPSYFLDGVAA
jgi:HTH-type transcriptional regulator, cell division transcriptional repressor